MKFSLIITVYNIDNYLEDCLNSVCEQDLPVNEYEVICIDDGSLDDSTNIIKKYQSQYSNIILISQKNKGVSAARNQGIAAASGEFIWFIDGDDMIAPNCLKELYETLCKDDLKILSFQYITVSEQFSYNHDMLPCSNQSGYVKTANTYVSSVWQKIFRRNFINKTFNEHLLYGEDDEFIFSLVLKEWPIREYQKIIYFYRQRRQSITHIHSNSINQIKLENTLWRIRHYLDNKGILIQNASHKQLELINYYEYNLYAVMLINLGKLKPFCKQQQTYFRILKNLGVYPYPIQWKRMRMNDNPMLFKIKLRKFFTELIRLWLPIRAYFFIFNCFYYLYLSPSDSIGD
ncbi:glycosyltransferase family 2 protein [Dielma fastidiosa]|uniref:glycosyltransferase family 2 protein n=1 Tax=Dielma fastidiosa TaxID=1034346 RepID=UPI0035695D66